MAMFIRVKRKKTTYFLHCDPSETVLETKHKLHALSDVPVDQQRLVLLASQIPLDDNKSLADQKVENDAVVALTLKIAVSGADEISGKWWQLVTATHDGVDGPLLRHFTVTSSRLHFNMKQENGKKSTSRNLLTMQI